MLGDITHALRDPFRADNGLVMLGKQVILLLAEAHEMKTAMQRATSVKRDVTGDGLAAQNR